MAQKKNRTKTTPKVRKPIQNRARETQRKILDAARELFSEIGFDQTTTHLVAERAGVSVGGMYAHFPNKEEVFLRILEDRSRETYEVTRETIQEIRQQNMAAADAIDYLFDSNYRAYARDVRLNLEMDRFTRMNSQAREIHDIWEQREADLVREWLEEVKGRLDIVDIDASIIVVARAAHEVYQFLYRNRDRVDEANVHAAFKRMVKKFFLPPRELLDRQI